MHEACDYTAGTDVFAGIKAGRLKILMTTLATHTLATTRRGQALCRGA
jgi:hypothetical protein